jgi:hypothetical protein
LASIYLTGQTRFKSASRLNPRFAILKIISSSAGLSQRRNPVRNSLQERGYALNFRNWLL